MVSGVAERNYPDVRVFNPYAPSNRHANLQLVYRKHEQIKKHAYEQRIREVEHATFSTLVVSATGDLARALHKQYHYSVSIKVEIYVRLFSLKLLRSGVTARNTSEKGNC